MVKHFNIQVSGRVQGVFFRSSAKAMADELNLAGFAQNKPDGSVYLEVEGEENKLNQFLKWCQKGPSFAQVDSVKFKEAPLEHFSVFEVI